MATIYGAADSTTGTDARTNVIYAIERLKAKAPNPILEDELITFVLPAGKRDDTHQIALFKQFLTINEKVDYDSKTKSYKFRPTHNIFTADDLLSYLQKQNTATGISVRELRDGWPNVEETIDQLEAQHKLLVTRNRKDNKAKMVWINDPTLNAPLDEEFKNIWESVPIPEHKEMIEILTKEKYHPAGSIAPPLAKAPVKKAKAKRKSTKVTNVHLGGMLRDFSKR